MFEEMIDRIQTITISRLLKGRIVRIPAQRPAPVQPAQEAQAAQPAAPVSAKPAVAGEMLSAKAPTNDLVPNAPGVPLPKVNAKKEVGRNDPCPCGSGKKYKNCCYWNDHK